MSAIQNIPIMANTSTVVFQRLWGTICTRSRMGVSEDVLSDGLLKRRDK